MEQQLLDKLGIDRDLKDYIEKVTIREWGSNIEQAEFTLKIEPGVLISGTLPGGEWEELDALDRLQLIMWFEEILKI